MKIAMLQQRARPLDTAHNLALLAQAVTSARHGGADLLVTPELFPVGYAPALIREHVTAEQVADLHQRLQGIAVEQKIALLYSLPGEEAPARRGITATLVSAMGERLAHYQKVQLYGPEEKAAFVPGDRPPPVVEVGGLRLGILICYDVEFPELVRAAAVQGADAVLVPTALADDVTEVPGVLVPARAVENGISLVYVNHCGEEAGLDFDGGSVAIDTSGKVLARMGEDPGLVYAEISGRPGLAEGIPSYLQDLRPQLWAEWEQARR